MGVRRILLLCALVVGGGGLSGSGCDDSGARRSDDPDASAGPGDASPDPDAAAEGGPNPREFCFLSRYCTTSVIGPNGFDLTTFQNLPADRTGVTMKNLELFSITVMFSGCAGTASVTLSPGEELSRHLDESPLGIAGSCVGGATHVSATGAFHIIGSFTRDAGATYTVYEPGGASWTYP